MLGVQGWAEGRWVAQGMVWHLPTHLPCQMFENNRVKFYMQTEVMELRAQEGKVGHSVPAMASRGGVGAN